MATRVKRTRGSEEVWTNLGLDPEPRVRRELPRSLWSRVTERYRGEGVYYVVGEGEAVGL